MKEMEERARWKSTLEVGGDNRVSAQ